MNIVKYYKNLTVQAKAALWFTVCSILQNGVHLITMPLYTRMLTTEQYGLSTLYFSWLDIVIIFSSLRLSAGVFNNGMVHFSDQRDKFQSSMLGLSTVSGIVCLLIYFIFSKFWDNFFSLPHILSIGMFLYCIFYPALSYWTARQRYEYKYIGFTVVTIGFVIITSIASIAFIAFAEDKGTMKIIGYTFASILFTLFFYIFILFKGKCFYDKDYWIYALKFNLPLLPHYLSMIILNQSDRIMIANMCGEAQAAIYGVAYHIGKIALIFNSAITASFTPWIYEKLKSKDYKNVSNVSTSLFLLILFMVFCIILLGPEVIFFFSTSEYMEAIYVIPPIAASVFFMFVYNQVSTVEFYYGKSKYIMIASILGALLNILLNNWGIRAFGFIAAAYTSLFCYILFALSHFLLMKKLCDANKIKTTLFSSRKILILSGFVLLFSALANILYKFLWLRYFVLLVIFVIFLKNKDRIISLLKTIRK